MKNKLFKLMLALNILVLASNTIFADVISPTDVIDRKMGEGAGPILLIVIGLAVIAGVTALIIVGIKKQSENSIQPHVEPVFGAAPKMDEKMEVNDNEKTNE